MTVDRRVLSFEELDAFMRKVERLREEGLSDTTIGYRLGVGRSTITERRKRWRIEKALGRGALNAQALDDALERTFGLREPQGSFKVK